ncbi:MAG TPA: hypothetical protein VLK84_29215 [Longimicrobium sp.]|nr:hypothetical protein [Longimicrobium sp.]
MILPGQQNATADEPLRRKQLRIRQELIDQAQAILGTRTASETIRRALELIVSPGEVPKARNDAAYAE